MSLNDRDRLKAVFQQCRAQTALLAAPLSIEDQTIQTTSDVSPTKWHLAHTSWFFETFLLKPFLRGYREINPIYNYLFNSYYEQIGDHWQRSERGLLSRPSVSEIGDYRMHIDKAMIQLFDKADDRVWAQCHQQILLGIHHEFQHQELLLTDIKHVMAYNPLRPVIYPREVAQKIENRANDLRKFTTFEGGIMKIGSDERDSAFHFDNETPQHKRLIQPFMLAETLVTNGDYLDFMEDGGYETSSLWLSDGWVIKQEQGWQSPLYWRKDDKKGWVEYTLGGEVPLDQQNPVTHISFYEASAFARWANKRLPLEEEIETACANMPIQGNLGRMIKNGKAQAVHPEPASSGDGLRQIYGDGWEWTQSAHTPYPNYRVDKDALGEYNGKFMCNQFILKGGSCATVEEQIRPSYRNFFPPHARWQFTAIRLADSI